jgi:hypothetical protein
MNALIQSLLAHPQRAIEMAIVVAVAIVFVALFMRKAVVVTFKVVLALGVLTVIAGGVAILMNDVSLAGPPGPVARLRRYLTVDWAATSATGSGAAGCADARELAAAGLPHRVGRLRRTADHISRAAVPTPPAADAGTQASAGNDYPELVRHSYPGIPSQRLFEIAANTAAELPGWQIVTTDPKTMTIDALYTTRMLGFRDKIRIVVTPNDEVDVCSRSRVGEPDVRSFLSFFHGDFGANIGHIKEFYAALAPSTNAAYRHLELRQTAEEHGDHP